MICLSQAAYDAIQAQFYWVIWVTAGLSLVMGGCVWECLRRMLGR